MQNAVRMFRHHDSYKGQCTTVAFSLRFTAIRVTQNTCMQTLDINSAESGLVLSKSYDDVIRNPITGQVLTHSESRISRREIVSNVTSYLAALFRKDRLA